MDERLGVPWKGSGGVAQNDPGAIPLRMFTSTPDLSTPLMHIPVIPSKRMDAIQMVALTKVSGSMPLFSSNCYYIIRIYNNVHENLQYLENLDKKTELIEFDRAWINFLLNYIPSEGDSLHSFTTTGAPGGFDSGPGIEGNISNGSISAKIQQINGSLLSSIGDDIWTGIGHMSGVPDISLDQKIADRTEQLHQARFFKVFDDTDVGKFII